MKEASALFNDLSMQARDLLAGSLRSRSFGKGEIIVSPGSIQKELYIVKKGVQMSYFETEHKMHVVAFTYPPGLSAIPESFMFRKPSPYTLSCITDSDMEYISYAALQELFDRSQETERLFRRMTEAVLAGVISRHIELHAHTMEERYRNFCNRSAHLLQVVPHKYIAAYLGIDPTNFSKLFNTVTF